MKKMYECRSKIGAGYEVAKSRDINIVGSQIKEVYQEVLDQYKNK